MTSGLDPRVGNPDWFANWTVGPGLRMEIIDSDGRVWLCHEPVTKQQVHGLELPSGASLALVGEAIADVAFFTRSPDADVDGPLDTIEVDGLQFSFVARPAGQRGGHQGGLDGAMVLSVDKHHTLLYAAGRTIEVLDFGDGTFAAPAWSGPGVERGETADAAEGSGRSSENHGVTRNTPGDLDRSAMVPAGSGPLRRDVELANDLIVVIPSPADVVIFGDGCGFHGPLPIAQLESALLVQSGHDRGGDTTAL